MTEPERRTVYGDLCGDLFATADDLNVLLAEAEALGFAVEVRGRGRTAATHDEDYRPTRIEVVLTHKPREILG